MSELSEYRRKVLKLSQEALSKELGYEKWQTYAAQERGDNPLPLEIKAKLEKKYRFKGAWPDQESGRAESEVGQMSSFGLGSSSGHSAMTAPPYVTREEYGALDARLKATEKALEETKSALIGATGAIRLIATKAGLPEIEALLK